MFLSVVFALIAAALCGVAEWLHLRRIRNAAGLIFGPRQRLSLFALAAPMLRTLCLAGFVWGLTLLLAIGPRSHSNRPLAKEKRQNLILVLDVSPSMRLQDGGTNRKQTRMQRASDVVQSIFDRTNPGGYTVSVIACYTKAMPVVERSIDPEVARHILNDLPMHYAFTPGKTNLSSGVEYAVKMAKDWPLASTTMVVISDGDSTPISSFPRLPPSMRDAVVLGVGDTLRALPIDGGMSRQESSSLQMLANRLGGQYANVNELQMPTQVLQGLAMNAGDPRQQLAHLREIALAVIALSSGIWMVLPILLHYFGTAWRPGRNVSRWSVVSGQAGEKAFAGREPVLLPTVKA